MLAVVLQAQLCVTLFLGLFLLYGHLLHLGVEVAVNLLLGDAAEASILGQQRYVSSVFTVW